jgi:hypothetical protein
MQSYVRERSNGYEPECASNPIEVRTMNDQAQTITTEADWTDPTAVEHARPWSAKLRLFLWCNDCDDTHDDVTAGGGKLKDFATHWNTGGLPKIS